MPRRLLVAVVAVLACTAPPLAGVARAQDVPVPALDLSPGFINTPGSPVRLADFGLEDLTAQLQTPVFRPVPTRGPSRVMLSLYASTAVMQAIDVHSTLRALDRGAAEGNPLLSGVAGNKAAFIGVKAAVAAGTIYATREIARKNKTAAILTLVAINSVYAVVAHHNYQVARGIR